MFSVKVELSHVKDEENGLKAELSNTPSRREFEELKTRVDKHSLMVYQISNSLSNMTNRIKIIRIHEECHFRDQTVSL